MCLHPGCEGISFVSMNYLFCDIVYLDALVQAVFDHGINKKDSAKCHELVTRYASYSPDAIEKIAFDF